MNDLSGFNQQVAACQDEAYTLAWYLLGDDAAAEAVVQAAVANVFHGYSISQAGKKSCRLSVLQAVLDQCQQQSTNPLPTTGASNGDGILEMLQRLPEREKQALVLIDILGLAYPEAAAVLGRSMKGIPGLLSRARRELAV